MFDLINNLHVSRYLHWIPLQFLHVVGDDLLDLILLSLSHLGDHGQGEGVVLVVDVWVLDLVVEEVVCSRTVLTTNIILGGDLIR